MNVLRYDSENPGKAVLQLGLLLVLPVIAFTTIWMAFAPLHSAAVASGQIVLTSDRVVVQHLEGGIVESIHVEEGQKIAQGAPIVLISSTAQLAKMAILQDRILDARTTRARLAAELSDSASIHFDSIGTDLKLSQSDARKYQIRQMAQFEATKTLQSQQKSLLVSKLSSIDSEIEGSHSSLEAKNKQLKIGQEQWSIKQSLQKSELASKAETLELEKVLVQLEHSVAETISHIDRLEKQRETLRLEYQHSLSQAKISTFDKLQEIEANLSSFEQEMLALNDQLERSQITAPISGKILDLQVHSSGEVIAPGARVVDIVPDQQDVIIEAKVAPQDIDIVTPGGEARIQLAAYNVKKVPRLGGVVSTVSADILVDPNSGQNYYLARIIVDQTPLLKLKTQVTLSPGMPAEVFLLSEEKTVLDYLISPLTTAAYRAFREE